MTDDPQQMMMEMQQKQQQLQQVMVQKEETEEEVQGIDKALNELEKDEDGEVFQAVGDIMVAKDRETLQNELEEKKEDLDVRKQSLEKKEGQLRDDLEEFQNQFSQNMGE